MTGPITWDVIYAFIGFAIAVLGIWLRIEARIKEGERNAAEAIKEVRASIEARTDEIIAVSKDLADYKLAASERFASHEHLKEVEVRLTASIDRLTNRIEQLPTRFAEEVARIVSDKPSRR